MDIIVTVQEVTYQVKHPMDGEMVKEFPKESGEWKDKYPFYGNMSRRDAIQECIEKAASIVNRRNMRAEGRCREEKNSILKLLIITNVV